MWTGIHPVYNDTMERDTHRYYWASKMAKDFIMATGKETFTGSEIEDYFRNNVLVNYLNEIVVEAAQIFERFLIETGKIKDVFFKDQVPYDARWIPELNAAKRAMKFVNMDSIYFQFAEMVRTNSSIYFKENLSDFDDFRPDKPFY